MVIQAELLHLAKHRRSTVLNNRSTREVIGPKPGWAGGKRVGGLSLHRGRERAKMAQTKWGSSLRGALLEVEM